MKVFLAKQPLYSKERNKELSIMPIVFGEGEADGLLICKFKSSIFSKIIGVYELFYCSRCDYEERETVLDTYVDCPH